jgi:hypothetical protein
VDTVVRDPDAAYRVPLLFGLGFVVILPLISGGRHLLDGIACLSDRAVACLTGYLRPPPDPWLEISLRQAFADFDRDLAAILHHHPGRR